MAVEFLKLIKPLKGKMGDDSGQSVIEFVLLLPLLIGVTVLLVRVNTTIQMSIVNQQYARNHAWFLTFNSPIFPQKSARLVASNPHGYNRLVVGVSENSTHQEELDAGGTKPVATSWTVARNKAASKDGSEVEPDETSKVRIRSTVALCSQSNVIDAGGGKPIPLGPSTLQEGFDPKAFMYCRSPL